jgi:hypothetical protein
MNGTPEEEGLIHQWAKSDKELYKKIEELETELKKQEKKSRSYQNDSIMSKQMFLSQI